MSLGYSLMGHLVGWCARAQGAALGRSASVEDADSGEPHVGWTRSSTSVSTLLFQKARDDAPQDAGGGEDLEPDDLVRDGHTEGVLHGDQKRDHDEGVDTERRKVGVLVESILGLEQPVQACPQH